MEALTEISNSIAFEIAAIETRQRKRTAEAQIAESLALSHTPNSKSLTV